MLENESKKGADYFTELSLRFQREQIECAAPEDDRLPILLDGQEIGVVTTGGGMRVRKESLDAPAASELYHRAGAIAAEVREYMTLMDSAPPLKAQSLDAPYKQLLDFNGYVLGGTSAQPQPHAMGAARRDPRRGEIPMMRARAVQVCRPRLGK